MARKRKLKDYSNVVIGLLFMTFFLVFAIKPSAELILSLLKEQNEYTALNSKLDAKIAEIVQAQNNYATVIQYQDAIDQALPDSHNLVDMKPLLSSESASIQAFSIKKTGVYPIEKGKLLPISLESKVQGSWDMIRSYLSTAQSQPRLYTIESLNIAAANGTSSGLLNAAVGLHLFLYKSP